MWLSGPIDINTVVADSDLSAWDFAFALITIIVAWIMGRFAQRAMLKLLARVQGINEDLRRLAARITKYFVYMLGAGVALTFLGASIQPILTAAILFAVVAGLALRGIADNFASGVVIQTRRPIEIGDEIESVDYVGRVLAINGTSVVIQSRDGQTVHIPNSTVLQNPLVNNSSHHIRRTTVEVRAARPDDIDATLRTIRDATEASEGVVASPDPVVTLASVDPSRIVALVYLWHGASDAASTATAVVRRIADALRAAGVDATVVTPPPPTPLTPPAPL